MGHDGVMARPDVTHVLLDFFGTLVGFSADRTEPGYHATHALVRSLGADADYPGFLRTWADESARFDQRSAADDSEYSMDEVAAGVLARPFEVRSGELHLPDVPGNGLEWDEDAVARYAADF